MKKIKFILITIWLSFMSIISPIWICIIYMDVTGNGKGYGYDLGEEAGVYAFFGTILLGLWILFILPAMVWLCVKCYNFKKIFIGIPIIGFIMLFVLSVFLIGWDRFIGAFGYY